MIGTLAQIFVILLVFLSAPYAVAVSAHGVKSGDGIDYGNTCLQPDTSSGFAVDTDGGAANGSQTHQSQISYQNQYGFKPDPEKFLGAVAIDPNLKLGAFDIICYENSSNQKQVCGFVFDNGYTSEQMNAGVKPSKPAEATALIHKQLGATYATGAGTSLSNTTIQSHPVKLPDHLKEEVKAALAVAKDTGNYHRVNQLAQELGGNSPCLGTRINPKYEILDASAW